MKQHGKNNQYIAGIERNKFWLYLLFLVLSLLIGIASIILGCFWNNSLLNFLLSLSASLVATPIFAYLLELIVSKQENNKKRMHRSMFVEPIATQINVLAFRIQALAGENIDRANNAIEYFENNYNKVFLEYCNLVSIIKNNRNDLMVLNKAFNIKNGIEKYSIEPIEKSLDALFKSEFLIKDESLISDIQIYKLKLLDEKIRDLKLPFLNELKSDYNHSTTIIDWPDTDISDLTKSNYLSSIKMLVSIINDLANNLDEFSSWKKK